MENPNYKREPSQLEQYQHLQIQALRKELQRLKDKYEPTNFKAEVNRVDINDPNYDRPISNLNVVFG